MEAPPIDTLLIKSRIPPVVQLTTDEYKELWNEHPTTLGQIKRQGRVVTTQRYTQSYLNAYYYSGMNHEAKAELPKHVDRIKAWVDGLGYGEFNQVLINWYEHGNHYITAHADDESQLVPGSPIISLSFGAARTFRIHPINGGKKVKDITLYDGDYIVMLSPMQTFYKHSIVKLTGIRAQLIGSRINITFRQFQKIETHPIQ